MGRYNIVTVLGPTATGKTAFAASLARALDGEVISGDSRQVYRGMTIGTGKDLDDYVVDGVAVPYHLVDIAEAGSQYNVYAFQRDFVAVFNDIRRRGKMPILCGGSGLYIEAALKGYKMVEVPANRDLRKRLEGKSLAELTEILASYGPLHNVTDTENCRRAMRAIEIAEYYKTHEPGGDDYPELRPLVVGVAVSRDERRRRISERLQKRIDEGMIDEVRGLLASGVTPEQLMYYGLEYKYVTRYVLGELTYEEFYAQLEIAIHQFAKRQMTWFRGMEERRGVEIHWVDVELPTAEKVEFVKGLLAKE